ncbi:MAG TPA: twin-arginine translocation signal domain-containing protein [Planctomycetes bacterium]|nr:twin-arginine translocation signal domain-containing protein [Planctomycetaceae bacterium]HIM31196.1 twin-arginine translocation signal domain-containing protein [Planctomycetota bacterium]
MSNDKSSRRSFLKASALTVGALSAAV